MERKEDPIGDIDRRSVGGDERPHARQEGHGGEQQTDGRDGQGLSCRLQVFPPRTANPIRPRKEKRYVEQAAFEAKIEVVGHRQRDGRRQKHPRTAPLIVPERQSDARKPEHGVGHEAERKLIVDVPRACAVQNRTENGQGPRLPFEPKQRVHGKHDESHLHDAESELPGDDGNHVSANRRKKGFHDHLEIEERGCRVVVGKLGEHVPAQTIGPRPRVPLRQGPLQEGCAGYHLRKLVVACRKRQLSQKEGRMGGKHHQNHQQQGNCLVRDSSTPPPTRRKGTRASTRRSSRRRNARPRSRRPHLRLARRSRFSPHGRTPPSAPFLRSRNQGNRQPP